MDLTGEVTCTEPHPWHEPLWQSPTDPNPILPSQPSFRVAVLDFGVKRNMLRHLVSLGCQVTVFPAATPAAAILEQQPDGILLSNGPGDPHAVVPAIRAIRTLVASGIPIMGICLGHQMLCLALGGQTGKLKFGHRGGNHPVRNLESGQVEVTSQNHGFQVLDQDLPASLITTHRSLFDHTIEGVRHRELPVFSVQYHPEASPGPHDAHYLFHRFVDRMRR
jgi:carbamoyl-phosphate synthase small subunit